MDTFLQQLIDFYGKNKELALILVGALVGWLLKEFFPALLSLIRWVLVKLGNIIGGQFAYASIQNRYLNWVVLHNQDLNLTGIIVSGEKPKLEQVFISLNISDEYTRQRDVEKQKEMRNRVWSNMILENLRQIWKIFWTLINILFGLAKHIFNFAFTSQKRTPLTIFVPPWPFWRLRLFLFPGGLALLIALAIFLMGVIPIYGLFGTSNANSLVTGLGAGIWCISIVLSILLLRGNLTRLTGWATAITFGALPLVTLIYAVRTRVIVGNQSPLAIIIGILVGIALTLALVVLTGDKALGKERTAMEVGSLLSQSDYIAILGKPGSGKSTYIQFIALTFAQEKAGQSKLRKPRIVKHRFGLQQWYLPILIPLRKVSGYREIKPNQIMLLDAFRQNVLPSEVINIFSDAFLRHMLQKKRCLFLLDGLDEVANDEEFRTVVKEIQGMISQFPGNKFIVTSRHSGWRGGIGSAFFQAEINDLNMEQITGFIENWYQAIEVNKKLTLAESKLEEARRFTVQRAREKAESLKQVLEDTENIRRLAQNPLLLSMICYVHYSKTLPKERLSLYEDCSRLLLEQWDVEKGFPQDDIPLKFAQKEILMEEIAYSLHSGKIGSGKEFRSEDIMPIIRQMLERFRMDPAQADILFKKLISRTGVLVITEQYKHLYGFSHLTFQEFYTAKYLHRNGIDIFRTIGRSGSDDTRNLTSWWREVILLYSGMKKDTSYIIQELCQTKTGDILQRQLQIATQCFVDALEKPTAETEQMLFNKLFDIRTYGEYEKAVTTFAQPIKQHLIRFATSDLFYEYVLLNTVRHIQDPKDAQTLAQTLIQLLGNADSDVQSAARKALLELWHTHSNAITPDVEALKQMLKAADMDTLLEIIRLIKADHARQLDHALIELVVQTALSSHKCQIRLYHREKFFDVNAWREFIQEITSAPFAQQHGAIQLQLAQELYEQLSFVPGLDSWHFPYLKGFLKGLAKALILVDSQDHKALHKLQLLEMLTKGTYLQQVWAIFLLEDTFNSEQDVIATMFQKLASPFSKVRSAAVSAFRHLNLEQDQIDQLQDLLQKVLKNSKKGRFAKAWSYIIEFIRGKGILGLTRGERLQIVGTLAFFMQTTDESARFGLSSGLEFRYTLFDDEQNEILGDLVGRPGEVAIAQQRRSDSLRVMEKKVNIYPKLDQSSRNDLILHLLNYHYTRGNETIQAMRLVRQLRPEIQLDSTLHEAVLKTLDDTIFLKADIGFDILLANRLV